MYIGYTWLYIISKSSSNPQVVAPRIAWVPRRPRHVSGTSPSPPPTWRQSWHALIYTRVRGEHNAARWHGLHRKRGDVVWVCHGMSVWKHSRNWGIWDAEMSLMRDVCLLMFGLDFHLNLLDIFFALFVIVTAFSIGVPEIDHQKTDSTDMTTKDRRPRLWMECIVTV